MLDTIISLTKQFISIPSDVYDTQELQKIFAVIKKELGVMPHLDYLTNGYPSIIYTNQDRNKNDFAIILNAHLDVVHGDPYQYTPIEKNGKLYGRGAYDMKAAAAVMILLFKEIATKLPYPIALQLVSDEEDSAIYGSKLHLQKGLRGKFVITGEGSNLDIINQSKGVYTLKLTTSGKKSHSGYPWKGENAITKMYHALDSIMHIYPAPKEEQYKTIVQVTGIHSKNISYNTIPADCTAYVDIRFTEEDQDTILQKIQSVLPPDISQELLCTYPANNTPENNIFIQSLQKAGQKTLQKRLDFRIAHATSDLGFFKEYGIEGIEFGPVGGDHHGHHEWVDIKGLEDYYHVLKQFLLSVQNL